MASVAGPSGGLACNTPSPDTQLPVIIYDCFSDTRFGGNVGGVVLQAGGLDTGHMQKIAREINAPVTGFVTGQDGREVTVRFFMPTAEIGMCGHVTVGLFSYLTEEAGMAPGTFVMHAQAGATEVEVKGPQGGPSTVLMAMGLPKLTQPEFDTEALSTALGLPCEMIGHSFPLERAEAGLNHLFVKVENLETVRNLTPDFRKLADVSKAIDVHTIACFSMQTDDPANTLHIRDFCPAVGADEVPASGTTNGALAGYLVRHGLVPAGAQTILAEQGSELGRPSQIRCDITSDADILTGVRVGGRAVASLKGTLFGG